jgi:hypothetical protein
MSDCINVKDGHNRLLYYRFILLKLLKFIVVWCVNTPSTLSHNVATL